MTFLQVVSGLLVCLGPLGVIFWGFIRPKPAYIVVAIIGNFAWVCAAILASLIWRILSPVAFFAPFPVLLTFACVSLARWLLAWLWLRVNRIYSPDSFVYSNLDFSVAAGWGLATAQVLITQSALWADSAGPGTLMSISCSGLSALALSSLLSSIFAILQITVTVMFFDGYIRQSRYHCLLPLLLYLIASSGTILNRLSGESLCISSLLLSFGVLVFSVVYCKIMNIIPFGKISI